MDEENEPSRELKQYFCDYAWRGMDVWLRGRHYVNLGPLYVDDKRQEVHLDKDSLYRQYFFYARIERKRRADSRALQAEMEMEVLNRYLESLEVEDGENGDADADSAYAAVDASDADDADTADAAAADAASADVATAAVAVEDEAKDN